MEFSRQTSQFYTGIGTHLPRGEFSICARFCCSDNQSLQFSFLVPLGTHHCYVGRGGMACTTPVTRPRTDRARRCLTSVIFTTRPCATAQSLWPLHGHSAAMPPSVRPSVRPSAMFTRAHVHCLSVHVSVCRACSSITQKVSKGFL